MNKRINSNNNNNNYRKKKLKINLMKSHHFNNNRPNFKKQKRNKVDYPMCINFEVMKVPLHLFRYSMMNSIFCPAPMTKQFDSGVLDKNPVYKFIKRT